MLVLSSLVFLGFVAFMRCLEVSIDDWEPGMCLAKLRGIYSELMPELVGVLAVTSEMEESVVMLRSRWQVLQKMLTVVGSVGVVTSVVFGADSGVLAYGVGASLYLPIGVGACAGLAVALITGRYQYRRWCEATPMALSTQVAVTTAGGRPADGAR